MHRLLCRFVQTLQDERSRARCTLHGHCGGGPWVLHRMDSHHRMPHVPRTPNIEGWPHPLLKPDDRPHRNECTMTPDFVSLCTFFNRATKGWAGGSASSSPGHCPRKWWPQGPRKWWRLLSDTGGGAGVTLPPPHSGLLAGPHTHPHQKCFPWEKKMKCIKGARNWRSISGTQNFLWTPPPPGVASTSP